MQYSKLFTRSPALVGAAAGLAAGVLFGAFIALAMHSVPFGLIEGAIFAIVAGTFFAWRVSEHKAHPVPAQWTPLLTLAFVMGGIVTVALVIGNIVFDNVGVAIAWAAIGIVYLCVVATVPSLNQEAQDQS